MDNKVKAILEGTAKGAISAIPWVGGAVNEILFDIRGRIAQNRINNFVNRFIEYANEVGTNLDEDIITSESFNDMYISIIKHVVNTKNECKLNIFKRILESDIREQYESDFKETFLELVDKLDYMEVEILKMFKDTGRSGSMDIPEGADGCVSSMATMGCKKKIISIIKERNTSITTLEAIEKYEFYMCDLISKSLLIDTKSVGNTYNDLEREGLTNFYITAFGKEFLKFVRYYNE